MADFTPGPWTVKMNRVGFGKWYRIYSAEIQATDGAVVALISDINVAENHEAACTEADARLIAAAPDLYEAAKDLIVLSIEAMKAVSSQPFDPESMLSIRRARAALAKAEGRTP